MVPPQGVTCFIKVYTEKTKKIFLSETTRPRPMIFGMQHRIYQVSSNYDSVAKNDFALGPHILHT